MRSRCWISALLAAALMPCAVAQVHGAGFGHRLTGFGHGVGFAGQHGRGFGRGAVFFGDPSLYADYSSGSLAGEMPAPPVVLLQSASPAAVAPEPKREPLLIELRGDQYVRVSGQAQGTSTAAESTALTTTRSSGVATGPRELPPAVLIFRDGHQEQVHDYVIASGILYARTDYWQSGSWRKEIQLSALDLPATLKTNQDHGVKFLLPSGPNEVVTRP